MIVYICYWDNRERGMNFHVEDFLKMYRLYDI